MQDVKLKVVTALPAAAASNNSASLDLQGVNNGFAKLVVDVPQLTALVDAKTVTYTLYDSADNSSFAVVEGYGNMVITGAGGVGAAAKIWKLMIHDHVRRYVRLNQAVLTAGGDNTAKSTTFGVAIP